MNVLRSVHRDAKAISMGKDKINSEIEFWENSKRKPRAVKQRLERLYTARNQIDENPEHIDTLIDDLKGIQNEST